MAWVLIVSMYSGFWANTNSVGVTNVPGFSSEAACTSAGEESKALARGTKKEVSFVCIQVK